LLQLNHILELLDGLKKQPGMMNVITTNCIEALHPALLRPGRMDVTLRLGHMEARALRNMSIAHFTEEHAFSEDRLRELGLDGTLTPAEASGIMLQSRVCASPAESSEIALRLLCERIARQ